MKKYFLILLCSFLLKPLFMQAADHPFPGLQQVATNFYKNYKFESKEVSLKFAKKKAGWYVYEVNSYKPDQILKDQLFWSREKGEYELLTYEKGFETFDFETSPYFQEDYYYQRSPYYGYNGWDLDVINDFGKEKKLNDTLLEGLARAYSNYAQGYLWAQFSYMTKGEDREEIKSTEPIPEKRIQKFISYEDLSLSTFKMLSEQYPKFQMIVGNSFMKYSNECVNAYYILNLLGKKEAAAKYINEKLFTDELLDYSKNILISCRKNAILFTNGDNDTYPLWYLQQKFHFRTDVSVINLSLLNLPRYIDFILKTDYFGTPVSITIPRAKYHENAMDYAVYNNNSSYETIALDSLILKMCDDKSGFLIHSVNDSYYSYPTKTIIVKTKEQLKTERDMVFTFKNSYLLRSDILLLDIINKNFGSRPVCWAVTTGDATRLNLDKYFELDGMTFCLCPVFDEEYSSETGKVNIKNMYDNIMNQFLWDNAKKYKTGMDDMFELMMKNVRVNIARLANDLIKNNQQDSALKVCEKALEVIPESAVPYDMYCLSFCEAYLDCGGKDKATAILMKICDNYEKDLAVLVLHQDNSEAAYQYQQVMAIMDYLVSLADRHYLTQLNDRVSKIIEKYKTTK
jgi:hypothetical protein